LFTTNVQQHPGSWNAYDSLGEGYAVAGKTTLAIENYSKALSMVSDEAQKTRIGQVLKALKRNRPRRAKRTESPARDAGRWGS